MFILKSLVAALALGLVQDTIAAAAAPACCTNKCGKSVQLAKNGKKDCSAFLIKTVIPTRTTTLSKTTTLTRTTTKSKTTTLTKTTTVPVFYRTITLSTTTTLSGTTTVSTLSTVIEEVTGTTDITVTDIASETDYSASTSLTTIEETAVVTDTATATETQFETTTVTYEPPAQTITLKKRNAKPTKPAYASACDNRAYTNACSCIGIKPKTTTKPAVIKTVCKTKTAYKTLTKSKTFTVYKTSTAYKTFTTHKTLTAYKTFTVREIETTTETVQAPPQTQTSVVLLTTYTTIISGTAITATETITRTESVTVTENTVVVATYTAPAPPPVCVGKGFKFRVTGSTATANGWWVGYINSIGQGIYPRLFSGDGTPMGIDSNGNFQGFNFGGTDFEYVIPSTAQPYPAQVWVKSAKNNISYTWASIKLTCGLAPAPNYQIQCTDPNGAVIQATFCWNTNVYDWVLTVYTSADQLAGKNCAADGFISATCVL